MKHRILPIPIIAAVLLLITGGAQASVLDPKLDIQDIDITDTGISWTTTTFDVDATAFQIITGGGPGTNINIPDLDFTLTSTGLLTSPVAGVHSGTMSGSFTVSGGALTGTFTDMTVAVNSLGGQFVGDVTYTGGFLAGAIPGGRIEGAWDSTGMAAKLGPVSLTPIPVPAAVWLFGSGLIGLVGVARRTKA